MEETHEHGHADDAEEEKRFDVVAAPDLRDGAADIAESYARRRPGRDEERGDDRKREAQRSSACAAALVDAFMQNSFGTR